MFDLIPEGRIARLRINRPEVRNAIPQDQWRVLVARLDEACASGAHVILLESSMQSHFCAGADFGDLARLTGNPTAQRDMRTSMRGACDRITTLPIPVIAAIDGGCFGAGVALAMACDMRIVGEGAEFSIPPARLGITYPYEDIAKLVALVGPGQAARLLYSGERIDAAEALRIGLVEQLGTNAHDVAQAIAANAPASISLLKQSIALAVHGTEHSDMLDRAFETGFDSVDFAEGMAAMRERRSPVFSR